MEIEYDKELKWIIVEGDQILDHGFTTEAEAQAELSKMANSRHPRRREIEGTLI